MSNIPRVKQACDELGLSYTIPDRCDNILEIPRDGTSTLRFVQRHTPVADDVFAMICKDKGFMYDILKTSQVRLPLTLQYLDPSAQEQYTQFVAHPSIESIISDLESHLHYPLVIKRSRGFLGYNVFVCHDRSQTQQAIQQVFTRNHLYDYICLAQEHIPIVKEYRVVVYQNTVQFAYRKNNHDAVFVDNHSPLHRQGAHAQLETNEKILKQLQDMVTLIAETLPLPYAGLDIALDHDGQCWLIEINSHPGFGLLVRDEGPQQVVSLYKQIIRDRMT